MTAGAAVLEAPQPLHSLQSCYCPESRRPSSRQAGLSRAPALLATPTRRFWPLGTAGGWWCLGAEGAVSQPEASAKLSQVGLGWAQRQADGVGTCVLPALTQVGPLLSCSSPYMEP